MKHPFITVEFVEELSPYQYIIRVITSTHPAFEINQKLIINDIPRRTNDVFAVINTNDGLALHKVVEAFSPLRFKWWI
jgi:hypothetical protein